MLEPVLDVLFPQGACCICRKPGRYGARQPWCQECLDSMIKLQSGTICERCGKYLAEDTALCSDCRANPPRFHIARAVGPYEDPYRITTKVLKFMGRKYLASQMGRMMAQKIKSEPGFGDIDMIVPVPISKSSLQVRGFNQAALLARKISKELGIKMECGALVRTRETPHQTELSKEERERNLACVFQVPDPSKVEGKSILLVDDVYTTGATSKECSRALLDAGASRVSIITWATGRGF